MPSPLRFLTVLAVAGVGGDTLRPGRYRLTITARAMAGGAGAKATTAFRIVR